MPKGKTVTIRVSESTFEEIKEVTPGHALIVKKDGRIWEEEINPTGDNARCSFERIYFSRGNDKDIYNERKMMGDVLVPKVLKAIDGDLENSVFSFIPNTAETSYYGMIKGLEDELNIRKIQRIKTANLEDENELKSILLERARVEKLILKDAKLRTFISQDEGRNDLVANVYDITHGTLEPGKDNLVVIDDSIVRGTTLKQSILRILDRLQPKKIVVASAAPQIRYPDCYGIDMAKMGDFIAFQAAVALLNERNMNHILDEVYEKCVAQSNLPKEEIKNYVQEVYAPFSEEEVSQKISELLTPHDLNADVEIVFQSVKDLHRCCPENPGDWYFTGNYPTPGGNRVVNRAFMNYMEGKNVRAY